MAISRKLSAMSDEQRDVRRYVKLAYFAMAACGLAAFAYLGGESDAHLASEGAAHRRRLGGGGPVVGWGKPGGKVKLDCHYMNPLYNYSDSAPAPDHYRQLAEEGGFPEVEGGKGLPDTAPPCPPAPPYKVHSCEVLYWDLTDFDTSGGVAVWLFIMCAPPPPPLLRPPPHPRPRAGSTASSASPSSATTCTPRRSMRLRCSRGARGRRRRTLHGGRVVGGRVLHGDSPRS